MLNERRGEPGFDLRRRMDDAKLIARLRLFGLLALLVPLFAGLQYVVREGVPRVEVRLVAQDVQTTVPVEVPVERVVERVIYVPVGGQAAVPPTESVQPVRASLPSSGEAAGGPDVPFGGVSPTDAPSRAAEPPAPTVIAEPLSETPPLTGTVALAPPAPAVAPVMSARQGPAPRIVTVPVEEVVEEAPEEIGVAESGASAMPSDQEPVVAEAEATEEVAVVQFVSEQPVVREDGGASISMLRHELYVRQPKSVPVQAEPVAEPEPLADTEESVPAAEPEAVAPPEIDEAGQMPPAVAAEPEAEQPADDEATESEAKPISSEELLAQAPTVKAEILDQGADNEQSLGVLEHQLVARNAPARPVAAREEKRAEAEADEQPVAAAPEDEEAAQVAESEPAEGVTDDEPIAGADVDVHEVARTDEAPEIEGEPEQ